MPKRTAKPSSKTLKVKRGRVANAIRTIVRSAAIRDEIEVDVDFVD